MKKTKIIATLGPASSDKKKIKEMILAGLNVARINFSHSSHKDAREMIKTVAELNEELNTNVAILGDLQGPKIRLGLVEEGLVINDGEEFILTNKEKVGDKDSVYITYQDFPKDVRKGDRILIDDGKVLLKVTATNRLDEVKTKVIHGGPIKSKKGVNLPNTKISIPSLTRKDLKDLIFALKENIEWIGLSFVRSADDVRSLQSIIRSRNSSARVVAKIEKPEAIEELDEIIQISGAVMVARGDLGVEVPMEQLPGLQKKIVRRCRRNSTPVIIATQMMESMIESMTPTRAEITDVANSVYDGADAVMLSGETSVGKFPVAVIKAMCSIIAEVESSEELIKPENPPVKVNERYISNSICYHACKLTDQVGAKAIISMTHSGFNAFKIASHRPDAQICVFTSNRKILNTLSLLWGTNGYFYDNAIGTDETINEVHDMLKEEGVLNNGDYVVNVASMPILEQGMTNMIKLSVIS